jgi:hypothetical protein
MLMLSGAFTVAETRDKPKMLVQQTVEAFDLHQIQNPPRRTENARPKWRAKLHPAMQRRQLAATSRRLASAQRFV